MTIDTDLARHAFVTIAQSQTFARERRPQVDNRGDAVDAYLASVGLAPSGDGPGQPWCMAFATWVGLLTGRVLGFDWPLPRNGSCAQVGTFADKTAHLVTDPAPGALMLVWHANATPAPRLAHAAIVVGPDVNGRLHTVEGNSNLNGSREGDGCYERKGTQARLPGPNDRFVHWWEMVDA